MNFAVVLIENTRAYDWHCVWVFDSSDKAQSYKDQIIRLKSTEASKELELPLDTWSICDCEQVLKHEFGISVIITKVLNN